VTGTMSRRVRRGERLIRGWGKVGIGTLLF
jgi:hypothetical protein